MNKSLRSLVAFAVCSLPVVGCSSSPDGDGAASSSSEALSECNHGPVVEGIDVGDGQGDIDWEAVRDAGIRFAYIKATQGDYNTQSTFAGNWTRSRERGVLRGAYHFFDPTRDGEAQADYFVRVMGRLSPDDLPPMLDIECPDGQNNCLGWTGGTGDEPGSVIRRRMFDWLEAVKRATGRTPIVYTFGSYFAGAHVDTAGLGSYPLFIAYPTSGNCFNFPGPWHKATLWQWSWTEHVPGIGPAVDRDRFLGTLAELEAFADGPATCASPEHVCGTGASAVCCPAAMNCQTCLAQ